MVLVGFLETIGKARLKHDLNVHCVDELEQQIAAQLAEGDEATDADYWRAVSVELGLAEESWTCQKGLTLTQETALAIWLSPAICMRLATCMMATARCDFGR